MADCLSQMILTSSIWLPVASFLYSIISAFLEVYAQQCHKLSLRHRPVAVDVEGNNELYHGGVDCAVCLGVVSGGDRSLRLPECNHVFHHRCISRWLKYQAICPLCRKNAVSHHRRRVADAGTSPSVSILRGMCEWMSNPFPPDFAFEVSQSCRYAW